MLEELEQITSEICAESLLCDLAMLTSMSKRRFLYKKKFFTTFHVH